MAFQRIGDILTRIRAVRRQLEECYRRTAERESGAPLGTLLEHMSWHERRLDAALADFDDAAPEEIRNTWIQNIPDDTVWRVIEDTEFHPGMDADEVIRRALGVDAALGKLYRTLATGLVPPRVKHLFEDLVEMERAKGKEYSNLLAELRDHAGRSDGGPVDA